jgi:hypothetical protein
LLVPSLPFFFRLPIKNGPRVGQLCQSRQMLETIDRRRGRVLREHGGVQPARPGDFPNCTPKTFRRRTTQIASRGTFEVVDVQPRSGFVTGDQFDRSEGAIPRNAPLFEDPPNSCGKRHLPTILGCPALAVGKR